MGLIVVDAGVIIAVLDATDTHHANARWSLAEFRARSDDLILPATVYAEVMVGALAAGASAAATLDEFIDALPARIEPVTRDIARAAGGLRAEHGRRLRLPDALVIATAIVLRADRVITTDSKWPGAPIAVTVVRAFHA
jgi:predicted nucleic acid-binding protein